jgi:hypothetical protein
MNQTVSDPWTESGAMVYVALTVATFSAVAMCCTWFLTQHPSFASRRGNPTDYGVVGGEDDAEVELFNMEDPAFTIDDDEDAAEDAMESDEEDAVEDDVEDDEEDDEDVTQAV